PDLADGASTTTSPASGTRSPSTTGSSRATVACREQPVGPTTYQYAERPGSPAGRTSLDLYLPAGCGPSPVVVWVHGGGWRRGDKTAGSVEQKATFAHRLGAALVAVNYRLSSPENDVRWPDHGEDVAAAVAWVADEGPSLGLDPSRLALVGHSAGAQLVASLATHPRLLADAGSDRAAVDCTVVLDVQLNLTARRGPSGLIDLAFGGDPAVLADASPLVQVREQGAPPSQLLVVSRGGARRVAGAAEFVDAVNTAGGSADLLDAGPYSHKQVSRELGAPGEEVVTPPSARFLQACLATPASPTATPGPAVP
ncbi:MAG: alpha/beta hydrolase, partial [Actinomycetes bacterium]